MSNLSPEPLSTSGRRALAATMRGTGRGSAASLVRPALEVLVGAVDVRLEVSEGLVELVARARREGWDRRQDLLVPMGVGRLGGIDVVDGPADPTELEERSLGCVAVSTRARAVLAVRASSRPSECQ
jgi:hypothetical protein